jgi:hypothetical protein
MAALRESIAQTKKQKPKSRRRTKKAS